MKLRTLACLILMCSGLGLIAQDKNLSPQDSVLIKQQLEEGKKPTSETDNRNVMLNAANNTSPRDVNIGLPSNVGGITILENDLPVNYFYWPELPNRTWRQSVSLEKTGLLKMEQLTNTMGDLGFAVNSYTQPGTKDFHFKGKISGSHFGWLQTDLNVSGPITKNGWTYSAGVFLNYDPNTYDLGFNKYADQTQIYRAGLTKYFKEDKGSLNIFYKYSNSYSIDNYAVFRYGKGGKAEELDDFTIGRGSYIQREGLFRLQNALTGEYYNTSLDQNEARSESHNIDIFGNYLLNNGWNFKYSARYHVAKASLLYTIPLSIFNVDESAGYTYASGGEAYAGNVGTQLIMASPRIPAQSIMGRFSLNKQVGKHNLTIGLLERYYSVDDYHSDRSFFFQTVEDQPQLLVSPNTDSYGFFNFNAGAEYYSGLENKLSLYMHDDWNVSDNFKFSYGLHVRHHYMGVDYTMDARTPGFVVDKSNLDHINKNWFHLAGTFNATYNIVSNFGVLANFLYMEENGKLNDLSAAFIPNFVKSKAPLGGLGIFWNTDKMSLVSQMTYLYKNNYLNRFNLVNPDDNTESQNTSVYYDIQTIGWTTDVVLKPFKGFNLHYLVTLQNPVYQKFDFNAFGNSYNYNDNSVLQISKVLMEIDPSYSFKKFRVWASFRYFSRQYANLTNALYFKARWENFGGVNYNPNKNWGFGLTAVNFLNQRGAKGTINGTELVTDPEPYYGQLLTGSYILPFTLQASISFKY